MKTESVTFAARKDPDRCPLRMRPGLRFRSEGPGNDWTCFLEDENAGRSYALSSWQRWFLELIEKKTPARDAARLVVASFPDVASPEAVTRFIDWLVDTELLEEVSTLPLNCGTREAAPQGTVNVKSPSSNAQTRRLAMNAVALLIGASGLWVLKPALRTPDPVTVAIPAVSVRSEMKSGQVIPIRAAAAGVLSEVMVRDGDAVDAGDLMLRIVDPEQQEILSELRKQLAESKQRRDRFYRESHNEGYTLELRRIAEISRLIGIHEALVTLSELRAPIAGLIETEPSGEHIGDAVARGDVLLSVHPNGSVDEELIAGAP